MPSGASAVTATHVLLGVALIKVGGTVIGVTRGGVRRTALDELAAIEYDGRVSAHTVGQDRYVVHGVRFETTLLQLEQGDLDRILNVSAGAPTAPKANVLYTSARYVSDVTFEWVRGRAGGTLRYTFPRALFQWSELSSEDRGTAQYAISVEPALDYAGAATTDDPPYSISLAGSDISNPEVAGAIHRWHPSAGSGQVLADAIGSVPLQLGTTSGVDADDPSWEASPPVLLFDGADDFVENVSPNFVADLAQFSFEGVLRLNALPAASGYFMSYYDAGQPGLPFAALRIDNDGSIHARTSNAGGGNEFAASAPGVITAGARFHVVLAYDGTTMRLYVNAVLVGSVVPAGGLWTEPGVDNHFGLGRLNSIAGPASVIHRHGTWRAYPFALSGVQVTANYNERKGVYTDLP